MNNLLNIGEVLKASSGTEYTILELTGSSGLGEYYLVESADKQFVLRMYYQSVSTSKQLQFVEQMVKRNAPGEEFIWPIDIVPYSNTWGVITNIIPKQFVSFSDYLKGKVDLGFEQICNVGINLCLAYNKLHTEGCCFLTESWFVFNPDNGSVLIPDYENISLKPDKEKVYGTARFMAPEIVRGESGQSRNTDRFTLAVQLFYLLMLSHPYEGLIESSMKALTVDNQLKLYGNPVYIWDPEDSSNRPDSKYHSNAIAYHSIYPEFINKLFEEAFVAGSKNPTKRVTESTWIDAFSRLKSCIVKCECGAENFVVGHSMQCWNCYRILKSNKEAHMHPGIILDANQKRVLEFLVENIRAWKDEKGLKALLADCLPDNKALRNVMLFSYQEGILDELNSVADDKKVLFRYHKILVNDYAIGEDVADWAVKTWKIIFDQISNENGITNTQQIGDSREIDLIDLFNEGKIDKNMLYVLNKANLYTLGDISNKTYDYMRDIRYMTEELLKSVIELLSCFGLKLNE